MRNPVFGHWNRNVAMSSVTPIFVDREVHRLSHFSYFNALRIPPPACGLPSRGHQQIFPIGSGNCRRLTSIFAFEAMATGVSFRTHGPPTARRHRASGGRRGHRTVSVGWPDAHSGQIVRHENNSLRSATMFSMRQALGRWSRGPLVAPAR